MNKFELIIRKKNMREAVINNKVETPAKIRIYSNFV